MKQKFTTKQIVYIALMAALVFVGTNLRVKIPLDFAPEGTMLHLGNVFCLLGGLLFGGVPGGLAAGFGSAIFDLTSEYASEAWITFINKFAMGFVAGLVAHWADSRVVTRSAWRARTILAAVAGSLTYCVLYLVKGFITAKYIMGLAMPAVWATLATKAAVTFTNAAIAVVASLVLVFALRPALEKAKILPPRPFAPEPGDAPKPDAAGK